MRHSTVIEFAQPGAWRLLARCRGADPDLFYPSLNEWDKAGIAQACCAICPVRIDCLEYALENKEDQGIWGGMRERERARMRRSRSQERRKSQLEVEGA